MTEQTPRRSVSLHRTETGRYVARNARGVEIELGHGDDLFSPVELLLAAIGGCSAIDLDYITAKRSEPTTFEVVIDAGRPEDSNDHRLADVGVDFHLEFPDTPQGQEAAGVVTRSVAQSRDRLCTVSRTVALGAPVIFSVDAEPVQ